MGAITITDTTTQQNIRHYYTTKSGTDYGFPHIKTRTRYIDAILSIDDKASVPGIGKTRH